MTSTQTPAPVEPGATQHIGQVITSQIERGVLMSLGARRLAYETHRGQPGLSFQATILPFTATGARSTAPRTMRVHVTLSPRDTYDLAVIYIARRGGLSTTLEHYTDTDIHVDQLNRRLLALDYDGPTALNPEYA